MLANIRIAELEKDKNEMALEIQQIHDSKAYMINEYEKILSQLSEECRN